ncbi:MAG TPA: hypothetical protein VK988_02100 [Acidimicrobiales bacterium]|nr:hypothetical protein [Acidimicrobiales bacterium]
MKQRYTRAVHQVALRSIHEVFEADRRGLIKTVSLEVGTNTTDRATGRAVYVPFVAAAAERDAFLAFDLAAVVPAATLEHLGAAVSKARTTSCRSTPAACGERERQPGGVQPAPWVAAAACRLDTTEGLDAGSLLAGSPSGVAAVAARRR